MTALTIAFTIATYYSPGSVSRKPIYAMSNGVMLEENMIYVNGKNKTLKTCGDFGKISDLGVDGDFRIDFQSYFFNLH